MLPLKITIGTFLRVYGSIGSLKICVRSYSGIYFQINELLRTLITLHILWIQNQHLILFKLRRFLTFDDTRLITLFWNTWLMMLIECYNSRENPKNMCITFPSSFSKKKLVSPEWFHEIIWKFDFFQAGCKTNNWNSVKLSTLLCKFLFGRNASRWTFVRYISQGNSSLFFKENIYKRFHELA